MRRTRTLLVTALIGATLVPSSPASAFEGCTVVHPLGFIGTGPEPGGSGQAAPLTTECYLVAEFDGNVYAAGANWLVTVWERCDSECELVKFGKQWNVVTTHSSATQPANVFLGGLPAGHLVRVRVTGPGLAIAGSATFGNLPV